MRPGAGSSSSAAGETSTPAAAATPGNGAAPPAYQAPSPSQLTVNPGDPVSFSVPPAIGSGTVSYSWRHNGVILVNGPAAGGGTISGATTTTLMISAAFAPDAGQYEAVATNACGSDSTAAALFVGGIPGVCYPNCDGSSIPPRLNVMDFICFQTKYAAGDSYANCDGSTAPPVLNVNDFICFQTRFSVGCP